MKTKTCGECKYYVFYNGLHCHICDQRTEYIMQVKRKDMACKFFEQKIKSEVKDDHRRQDTADVG